MKNHAQGSQNKRVTVNVIKNIEIAIPIDKKGNFSIEYQKQIADKMINLLELKSEINAKLNELINSSIEFDLDLKNI